MARRLDVEHLQNGRRCRGVLALSSEKPEATQVTECFCNGSEVPQFDPQWNILEKLNF